MDLDKAILMMFVEIINVVLKFNNTFDPLFSPFQCFPLPNWPSNECGLGQISVLLTYPKGWVFHFPVDCFVTSCFVGDTDQITGLWQCDHQIIWRGSLQPPESGQIKLNINFSWNDPSWVSINKENDKKFDVFIDTQSQFKNLGISRTEFLVFSWNRSPY